MGSLWKFQEDLLAKIQRQAEQIYPEECCGILLGHRDELIVQEASAAQNAVSGNRSREHFQIDPLDLYQTEKKAAEKGMEVIGFFHSHTDHPAELSAEDERNMIPELLYLIVAVEESGCGETKLYIKEKLDEGARELYTDY